MEYNDNLNGIGQVATMRCMDGFEYVGKANKSVQFFKMRAVIFQSLTSLGLCLYLKLLKHLKTGRMYLLNI